MSSYRLDQIGRVITGKTPKTAEADNFGGDIPFITPSDMDGRRKIDRTDRYLSAKGAATVKNCAISENAVLVSCIGSDMGKTHLATRRSVTNQQINSVVVDQSRFDALFIYYNLFGRRQEIRNLAAGSSAQPILNKSDFSAIEIETPPLPEQREIAAILGALDDKIELNRKTAAVLEEMARALYRSWFVDFDPVWAKAEGRPPAHMDPATAALFPDGFDDAGLPLGWQVSTIGEVAEIVGGSTPSTKEPAFWEGGNHNWATPRDLSNLGQPVIFETDRKVTDQGLAQIGSGLSPAGTLLLSSRAPIGYLAIAKSPVAVNQGFIAIRETDKISALEAYCWCHENMEAVHANANGSTFQEISKKNFRPLPYVLASSAVRKAFNLEADSLFQRLSVLCEENQTLATLRDSLLPRLMSGELRVGTARAMLDEVA